MLEESQRICKDQFYECRPAAKAFTLNSVLPWLRQLQSSSSPSALHRLSLLCWALLPLTHAAPTESQTSKLFKQSVPTLSDTPKSQWNLVPQLREKRGGGKLPKHCFHKNCVVNDYPRKAQVGHHQTCTVLASNSWEGGSVLKSKM